MANTKWPKYFTKYFYISVCHPMKKVIGAELRVIYATRLLLINFENVVNMGENWVDYYKLSRNC